MRNRTPVRMVLAQNLSRIKEVRKLSQKALSDLSGVAQTSISNMLNAEKNQPRLDQIEKVAHGLGLATWQLLLDRKMVGDELADMLMRAAAENERLHENGITAVQHGGVLAGTAHKSEKARR